MATLQTIATVALQWAHVKLLCSRCTSIWEGTPISTGLPIPVYPPKLTIQACPAHLDAHHIIQTHILTTNVQHSPLRGPQYMRNVLNHPPPMFRLRTGPTRCLLDRLAQSIQTSQDLSKATRGKQECLLSYLTRRLQTSQDLPEVTKAMRGKQECLLSHLTQRLQTSQDLPEVMKATRGKQECLLSHLTQCLQTSQDLPEVTKATRGKQECLLSHLMQRLQTSQDLLEVTRGMQNHLWRPTAKLQSLLEMSVYPQLDLMHHPRQLA